jgi:hypothetical protein
VSKLIRQVSQQIRTIVVEVAPNPKVRKRLLVAIAVFCVLQLYFVRELIAAELLFGLGFAVLLVLAGIFYVVGAIGERVIGATETGALAVARSARDGYSKASPVLDVVVNRGMNFAVASAKFAVQVSRRGYQKLEEISKRPFRHPRSESAR